MDLILYAMFFQSYNVKSEAFMSAIEINRDKSLIMHD